MAHTDTLGDTLKPQEQLEAGRKADPYLPLMARIDGHCFSSYTRNLNKPFDLGFVDLMIETTKHVVEKSEASLGYCQSDEITLYWHLDKENYSNREYWFGGKYQKLVSILASAATSFFSVNAPKFLSGKDGQYPEFDARVWNVPDLHHAYLNFLWRWQDAQRNSVSMYARHFFSHKELQGKTCRAMKEMLSEIGHPWDSLPVNLTHGTFLRKETYLADPSQLEIPEKYRPTGPVLRSRIATWVPSSMAEVADFVEGYDGHINWSPLGPVKELTS